MSLEQTIAIICLNNLSKSMIKVVTFDCVKGLLGVRIESNYKGRFDYIQIDCLSQLNYAYICRIKSVDGRKWKDKFETANVPFVAAVCGRQ